MTVHGWLTLLTCTGELAFFALAATRTTRSPLALPAAMLSVAMFASNLAALGFDVSGDPVWNWIDNAVSPLTTPLSLHFLIAFVGRRRQLRGLIIANYVAFGLLSATSLLAFVTPWAREFSASSTWSLLHLLGIVPSIAVGVTLFVLHLRQTTSDEERQRTRLLLLAFAVLAVVGTTDLWEHVGLPIPRLGNVGTLIFTALVAVVALRLRLFDRDLSSSVLLFAFGLGTLGIGIYVGAFRTLAANAALLVLATATVTFALTAAGWPVLSGLRARRERMQRLALTGRLTAQMAHDLKNPLAALKGAAQYLAEEHAQGHSLDDKGDFIQLLLEQVTRVQTVLDGYHRLVRVEPVLQLLDLNEVVARVLALQHFAAGSNIAVRTELGANLPKCPGDSDLLSAVIENLVRNAYEAMPNGGTLTVRTAPAETSGIILSVQDTGSGMDSRTAERVFDEFFTTKATGSGLGLAFVRRVAEAHRGEVSLTSREGLGTVVQLRLPGA